MLKFTFQGQEVADLQQLEFLIANDGERAISQCIEPLSLQLPEGVALLDISILYRRPKDLDIKINKNTVEKKTNIRFEFPLLNKGDYFLVKLLLSGTISPQKLMFHIIADDLPRSLKPKWLPSGATKKSMNIEWSAVGVGIGIFFFGVSLAYALYLLYLVRPDLFPYPWSTFKPTILTVTSLLFWAAGLILSGIAAFALLVAIGFEDVFSRVPRFPLPDELNRRGIALDLDYLLEEQDESKSDKKEEVPAQQKNSSK